MNQFISTIIIFLHFFFTNVTLSHNFSVFISVFDKKKVYILKSKNNIKKYLY